MSQEKPLSPAETMRAIAEQAARDAIDEVTSLPEGAVDAELKAAGVDPAEAERRAMAAIEAALAGAGGAAEAPASKVVTLPKAAARAPSRRWVVVGSIAAAAAVAATVGAMNAGRIVEALRGGPEPIRPDEYPPPTATRREPTPVDKATALRDKAFESCSAHDWDLCAQRLDDAKAMDPAGEERPEVIAARRAIAKAKDDEGKKLK